MQMALYLPFFLLPLCKLLFLTFCYQLRLSSSTLCNIYGLCRCLQRQGYHIWVPFRQLQKSRSLNVRWCVSWKPRKRKQLNAKFMDSKQYSFCVSVGLDSPTRILETDL